MIGPYKIYLKLNIKYAASSASTMAHVSADKELRITLLIDLDFQFKGEQLPNSSQINIINPSVLFFVGKLPSDASLKHFIEQLSRLCKTGNFNFNGFNFNFII